MEENISEQEKVRRKGEGERVKDVGSLKKREASRRRGGERAKERG